MMHRNPLWLVFLNVVALTTIFFAGKSAYLLYNHYRLDARAPIETISWSVYEKNSEQYYVQGDYTYVIDGQSYRGKTILDEAHRNRWAAEHAIATREHRRNEVWYSLKRPSYSSLQKTFPLKECLTTGLLVGILLYLLGLGYYVGRLQK